MKQPLEKRIYFIALIIPVILGGLLVLISPTHYKFSLGIILGGLMGALIFRILTLDVYRLTGTFSGDIKKQALKNYFKRFSMYAATLVIGMVSPYISFVATLIGLLLPKLITIILIYLLRRD